MKCALRGLFGWLVLATSLAFFPGTSPGAAAGETHGDTASVAAPETGAAAAKPGYLTRLESAYGASSQAGFGSAVFYEILQGTDDLSRAALAKYRYFVGKLWDRYGEAARMGPWKEVYTRPPDMKPDVVSELRGIADREAQLSVPMILDNTEGAEAARAALSDTFDDAAVTELRAFNLGDGEAMSGLLVPGRRGSTGESTLLVFLMD